MKLSPAKTPAYDFDTPVDRRAGDSMKWQKYDGKDILPLWVADMDYSSPPAVIEALQQRCAHGVFGYAVPPEGLTQAVRQRCEQRYGWSVAEEWIVWIPGLVTGLNSACRAVGEDGDDVLTTVPVYPPVLSAPGYSRRNRITVPLALSDGRWEFDFQRLEGAVTPQTRLFILCHPYNPVGRVFSRTEIRTLADICRRHEVVVCSDEIHCDLILDPEKAHVPFVAAAPEMADRTITLMAPSKTFNLPGLGCSFAVIANPRLRARFKQAMAGIVPHVGIMGFTGALAAYRHGAGWHKALLAYLRQNRERVLNAVARMPGVSTTPVEATYLAWIDARGTNLADPAAFFETAGVGLSDGREFRGPGYVRLNFGCPRATLEEALGRMQRALEVHARETHSDAGVS
jgi:cystathionine beta-lyase